jgi:hypothetical protein
LMVENFQMLQETDKLMKVVQSLSKET